jgi:predicted RNA binding protein YcfA (HicA-like mRNA interferase family)
MPNKMYARGVRFERETIKHYKECGYRASRTAGSHGDYDVIAYHSERPVEMIQCKTVRTVVDASRMIRKFKENPPTIPAKHYHQVLRVKVMGKSVYHVTV